jgi:hypothetical protein
VGTFGPNTSSARRATTAPRSESIRARSRSPAAKGSASQLVG